MQYTTKKIQETTDVLKLSKDEYSNFNKAYKDAIRNKLSQTMKDEELKRAMNVVGDLKIAILTDGYHRVEFSVDY